MHTSHVTRKARFIGAIIGALALMMAASIAVAPRIAYAEDYPLQVVGTPTVNVYTGGTADMTITLKNTTNQDLEDISIWEASTYDDPVYGEICPYTFQSQRSPSPTGDAIVRGFGLDETYGIRANGTATFHVLVRSYDMAPGTYRHTIQLADWGWEVNEWDEWGNPASSTKTLYRMYTAPIAVTMVNYNPADAALTVGTGTAYGGTITAFPSSGISFNNINLATATGEALTQETPFWIKNTSPTIDSYTGDYPEITLVQGTYLEYPWGVYSDYESPISYYNGYGLWSSDTTVGKNASHGVAVSVDATGFIAGTYTANVVIETIPHQVKVNGGAVNDAGRYTVPVTVTLTGTNPNLPARAANLAATPGNGMIELTWKPSSEDPGAEVGYYVYRREGLEANRNPDTWTWENWQNYERLNFNPIISKYDSDAGSLVYLYVDGTVDNDTAYSYVVIADEPFKGYASVPASATPDGSIESRLLAPDVRASESDESGFIAVSWCLDDYYGGSGADGVGVVDYFNVYLDGALVKRVYQSAVNDEVTQGWITDDYGNSYYGIVSHSYSWEVDVAAPQMGQDYTINVAAVDKHGIEGYWSYDTFASVTPDIPQIVGQETYFILNTSTKGTLNILMTTAGWDDIDTLEFWRATGTTAPDTDAEPYATVPKVYGYGTGYDLVEENAPKNAVYTYTVQGTTYGGDKTNFYTFTVGAAEDADFSSIYGLTWQVKDGRTPTLSWYSDYWYNDKTDEYEYIGTYKVYRNGELVQTLTGRAGGLTYSDTPTQDGTYVYRVDKEYTVGGTTITVPGTEFTFTRAADGGGFVTPPDAPTLTARLVDGKPILAWVPAATGDAPTGYHIYRIDGNEPVLGHRQVTYVRQGIPYDRQELWGNARYLTIQDGSVTAFADGVSGYYQGDVHLGQLTGVSWYEENCPHTYWITAYNEAGESERSEVVTFAYPGGDVTDLTTPATELPAQPVIDDVWIEWDESSSWSSGFDNAIGGRIHVAWSEGSPVYGDISQWNIRVAGLKNEYSNAITYAQTVSDPAIMNGEASDYGVSVDAQSGSSGDLGHTATITVTASNSEGDVPSTPVEVAVLSFPRSYALPDSGGAVVRWTDLFEDTTTQVTGWEIWRKVEYGIWERIDVLPATLEYAGVDAVDSSINYYEWADTGLDNGWTYQYTVVAKCADGVDRPGRVLDVTPDPQSTTVVPSAPRNFQAQVVNGEVLFTWDPPETGTAAYYEVLYEWQPTWQEEPMWIRCGGAQAPSTSAVWAPDEAGTYRFFVYAYNYISGEQVPQGANLYDTDDIDELYPSHSAIEVVTVDPAQQATSYPKKPVLTLTPGEGQITLNWTLESNGSAPTYFEISRVNPDGSSGFSGITLPASVYSFVDVTAEPGERYGYEVVARNSYGQNHSQTVYARATGTTRDEIAAQRVSDLIDALPAPDAVSVGDADQIRAVSEAFDNLTDKQKALISDAAKQKLADDIAALEELELLERYRDLVAPVQTMIDALPDATAVTAAHEEQIVAARAAYDAITPAEAKRIVDTTRLVAAEEALEVAPVKAAIDMLPDSGSIDLTYAEVVTAVRAAYEALTPDQQVLVGQERADKLAACEQRIADLAAAEAAAAVDTLIDGIGEVTLDSGPSIQDAREAYNALPDAAKAKVTKLDVLEAAETAFAVLQDQAAVEAVQAHINALPDADDVTEDDQADIAAARAAYNALRDDLKSRVDTSRLEAAEAALTPVLEVYAGATRYDVSTMISTTLTADDSFDGIVVVSGENNKFADALSASGLAGLLDYPLVVLNGYGLTDADRATLANYAGDERDLDIIVIGGTATVTPAVETALGNYGTVSMRIAGADRYAVNSAVYEYGLTRTDRGSWGDTVFVARGDNFPDALTVAPYLVSRACPIILVDPKATALTDAQRTIAQGINRGMVLGGTASVTEALEFDLGTTCGFSDRLGGADRYEASANIVKWELGEGMSLAGAGFATGAKFPDALGSGFLLGSNDSVLCLVDPRGANAAMGEVLEDAGLRPHLMRVFGGTASVPENIYNQMTSAVGWTSFEKDYQ